MTQTPAILASLQSADQALVNAYRIAEDKSDAKSMRARGHEVRIIKLSEYDYMIYCL